MSRYSGGFTARNGDSGPLATVARLALLEITPLAEAFEMMPDDELDELAADIKANGLHEPIVVAEVLAKPDDKKATKMLVDGRNRREACRRAEIDSPRFEVPSLEDSTAYVILVNMGRRDMTKGQKAMVYAKIYPETTAKGGRGKALTGSTVSGVDRSYINRARAILEHAPALVPNVVNVVESLNTAYETANKLRKAVVPGLDRHGDRRGRQSARLLAHVAILAKNTAFRGISGV